MARDNNQKLRLYEDEFSEATHTDETRIENALQTNPDLISTSLVWLLGDMTENYPMSFITEGMGNKKYIESTEFQYPVIQDIDKSVAISTGIQTGQPGRGNVPFDVEFEDNWFIYGAIIMGPSRTQCRVMEEPEKVASGGYRYRLQLTGSGGDNNSVPLSDLVSGVRWSQVYTAFTHSGSKGTNNRTMTPSRMYNQINTYRRSFTFEGIAPDRTMNLTINTKKGKFNTWGPWENMQFMKKMQDELEFLYWYSELNKSPAGNIPLQDYNGKPIKLGSGIFDQIPNWEPYAELTAKRLNDLMYDIFFNIHDAEKKQIMLYTGSLGMRLFDQALKSELSNFQVVDTLIHTKNGEDLKYGKYYTTMRTVEGHEITLRKLPLLDYGPEARTSPNHPDYNLPLSSGKMIFLDQSTYNGEPNIQHVTRKGREMIMGEIDGMTNSGSSSSTKISTDFDGASVHYLKECGIHMQRANTSFVLECVKE
jgi:hypothetical protein